MTLLELFDKGVNAHWFDMSEVGGHAEFIIGEQRYSFMISEYDVGEDWEIQAWTVEFALLDGNGDPRYDNTRTGNQLPLYSTILKLCREYISEYGERPLVFGAADPGRKTLYARLMGRFLNGWNITTNANYVTAWPPGQEEVPVK